MTSAQDCSIEEANIKAAATQRYFNLATTTTFLMFARLFFLIHFLPHCKLWLNICIRIYLVLKKINNAIKTKILNATVNTSRGEKG